MRLVPFVALERNYWEQLVQLLLSCCKLTPKAFHSLRYESAELVIPGFRLFKVLDVSFLLASGLSEPLWMSFHPRKISLSFFDSAPTTFLVTCFVLLGVV